MPKYSFNKLTSMHDLIRAYILRNSLRKLVLCNKLKAQAVAQPPFLLLMPGNHGDKCHRVHCEPAAAVILIRNNSLCSADCLSRSFFTLYTLTLPVLVCVCVFARMQFFLKTVFYYYFQHILTGTLALYLKTS